MYMDMKYIYMYIQYMSIYIHVYTIYDIIAARRRPARS